MPNNTLLEIQPGFGRPHTISSSPLGPLVAELQDHVEDMEDALGDSVLTVGDDIADLQGAHFTRDIDISFEASEVGTHKLFFPDAAVITKMRVFTTQDLAATDDGTVTLRNSAAAAMANGAITVPASSVFGYEPAAVVPTTNNTVTAGSFIQILTAKTTPGGGVRVTIEYTRTPA